jgi:hypothetical protein
MSKVKTDAIETRAGGTSVLTIGTATQTIKLPGGTPGADKVLTSNATGEASWVAAAAGGKVAQVQYMDYDTTVSANAASYFSTGLSIAITPTSASNYIVGQFTLSIYTPTSPRGFGMEMRENTVAFYAPADYYVDWNSESGYGRYRGSWFFKRTPASTSALTYEMFIRPDGGDLVTLNASSTYSSMIIYELAPN